jgi:hypothetical protein
MDDCAGNFGQEQPMKRSPLSPAVIIALIGLLGLAHIVWLSFICDDAFISFRYAKNLQDGHGLVFNIGERVEGYTNFLWVLIGALIIDAGARPEVWSLWIGAACALITLGTVLLYLQRTRRDYLFAGFLLAANGGFAAWATGGLETSVFTMLVTLGCLCLLWVFEPHRELGSESRAGYAVRPVWLSAAFLFLAALSRPEGVLVTGLCGIFLLIQIARKRFNLRMLLLWAAVWIIPYSAYFLWRYQYYGHLFPNTFYVKTSGLMMLSAGIEYLLYAAQRFHLYILLVPAIVLLVARRGLGIGKELLWFTLLIIVPYLGYVMLVGGDFMDMFRFVVPVIPLAMLAIGQTWRSFYKLLSARWSRTSAIGAVTALLVAAMGLNLYTSWDSQAIWFRHGLDSIGLLRKYSDDWTVAAQYYARASLPTDSIAITAAGIIPYYTGLYTVDQLGLIAQSLDGYLVQRKPRAGHALLASGKHLFKLRPQFIVGHPKMFSDSTRVIANLFVEEAWHPELNKQYERIQVRLGTSPPRHMAFAVRRDVTQTARSQRQGGARVAPVPDSSALPPD